jgi:type II secretory pathway predicted ATPase ExeA/tetratricopeptide (TPR) repeat protein
MFDSFYSVAENPFKICTDPRFLWCGEKHTQVLSNLIYALLDRNGLVVLTGDIGTGKTTLVNALLNIIDADAYVARINYPSLNAMEFLRAVAKCLDPDFSGRDKCDLLLFFDSFSQRVHDEGKAVLIIIDEAQHLSMEVLEEIRLLSNMERDGQRILSVMLVGQLELLPKIEAPQSRSLHQRVTLFCEMQALGEAETPLYVGYRLKVSGLREQLFTSRAMQMIHTFSRGNPRLVNILCDRAMRIGRMKKHRKIDADIIIESARDMKLCSPAKLKAYALLGPDRFTWCREQRAKLIKWVQAAGPAFQKARSRIRQQGKIIIPQIHSVFRTITHKFPADYTRLVTAYRSKNHRPMWIAAIGIIAIVVGVNVYQATHDKMNPDDTAAVQEMPVQWTAPSHFDKSQLATAENALPDPTLAASISSSVAPQRFPDPLHASAGTGAPPEADIPEPASPSVPGKPEATPLALAATALEQKAYQKAIRLLESRQRGGIEQDQDAAGLYSDALVGRALEIMSASPSDAEAMLRRAVDVFPDNAQAHVALGKYHTRKKAYVQAITDYRNAIRLDPGLSDALFNLGYIYAATGRLEEAETAFNRAVQLRPPYLGKSLFNLGVVQHKLGKMEQGLANLEKAAALMPNNEKVVAYVNRLKHRAPGTGGQ